MSKLEIKCADGKRLIWQNLGDGEPDCNSGEDETIKWPCTTPKPIVLECTNRPPSNDYDFSSTSRRPNFDEKSGDDGSPILSYVTPLITFFVGMFIFWIACTGKREKGKKSGKIEDTNTGFMNMEMKNLFKKNFMKILDSIPNDLEKLETTKKKVRTLMKLKVS